MDERKDFLERAAIQFLSGQAMHIPDRQDVRENEVKKALALANTLADALGYPEVEG